MANDGQAEKPIRTLIVEDVEVLADTIKGRFEQEKGVRSADGTVRRFECEAYPGLQQMIHEGVPDRITEFELAIIDLHLGEGEYAGVHVLLDGRFGNPDMKKVVFTGLGGRNFERRDLLSICTRMVRLGAWDFIVKEAVLDKHGNPSMGPVEYLYQRVVEKWERETVEARRMEAARLLSLPIRSKRSELWSGKYVAFYSNSEGTQVFPGEGELAGNPDGAPTGDSYLEVMVKYLALRRGNEDRIPEFPFVTFMDTLPGEME